LWQTYYTKKKFHYESFFTRCTSFYNLPPHFVSYNVENLPNKYVDKCKKRKIAVLGWTVKSQHIYDKIKSYVDNIIFEGFEPK